MRLYEKLGRSVTDVIKEYCPDIIDLYGRLGFINRYIQSKVDDIPICLVVHIIIIIFLYFIANGIFFEWLFFSFSSVPFADDCVAQQIVLFTYVVGSFLL